MTKRISGPSLIFIAAVLWAFDGILRRSLYSLAPAVIVFYEHLIGSLILVPIAWSGLRKLKLTPELWKALIWVAALSGVAGTLLFTAALGATNFIPFSVVFLLQKLQPVFAILAASMVLKEKLPQQYLGWAGLALVAAYFVTFPNGVVNKEADAGQVTAALMAVGAAFAWGSSTAFSRKLLLKVPNTEATALRFWLATPMALLAVFLLGSTGSLSMVTPDQVGRLVVIAFSTGMAALWIYYKGLAKTEAKVSTIVELAFPLLAVVIDMFLYQSYLVPSQYVAAMVLLWAMHRVAGVNKG